MLVSKAIGGSMGFETIAGILGVISSIATIALLLYKLLS